MTHETPRQVLRTCVGCRQKAERESLMRLVLAGDPALVVPDVRKRASGRGVSVHPRLECLRTAVKRGALKRAFRTSVEADADQLAGWAREQYARRIGGLLTGAYRAGHVALGSERARAALSSRKVELLVVAADAAGRREELGEAAGRLGERGLVYGQKETLGRLFGRQELAVLAVLDRGVARELRSAADSATQLAEAS